MIEMFKILNGKYEHWLADFMSRQEDYPGFKKHMYQEILFCAL